MTSDLINGRLGDFVAFKNGKSSPVRNNEYSFNVYGSNGIIGKSESTNADKHTLIIGRVGSYCGSVYYSPDECWVTDNAIIGTSKQDEEARFWYYKLLSLGLNNYRSGSGQPLLNQQILNGININVPDRADRLIIANILGALDDKIELNRQINQTLEQIAQAIFKSWFVDFDLVKAKILAKTSLTQTLSQRARAKLPSPFGRGAGGEGKESEDKSFLEKALKDPIERAAMCAISGKSEPELDQLPSETLEQLAATAALFPDELVESELGLIPKGWYITNLGAITSELRRGISPKYIDEGGVQVINQKCIRGHTIDFSISRRNDTKKRKIDGREIKVGDILINSTGVGTLGRLAPVRYLSEPTAVDSHVTVVRGLEGKVTSSFLQGLLLAKESFIESSGTGSTGQTELRRQVIEDIAACLPNYKIQEAFQNIVKPISNNIAQNEQQQKSLGMTRDALLPKLIAGEIELNKG